MSQRKQMKDILLRLQDLIKKWSDLDKKGEKLLLNFSALVGSFSSLSSEGAPLEPSGKPSTFALDAEVTLRSIHILLEDYQALVSQFTDAALACDSVISTINDVDALSALPKNESGLSLLVYNNLIHQICGDYLKEYGVKETMIKDLKFEMRTDVISLYHVVWKNSPYIEEGGYAGIFARVAFDS